MTIIMIDIILELLTNLEIDRYNIFMTSNNEKSRVVTETDLERDFDEIKRLKEKLEDMYESPSSKREKAVWSGRDSQE